MKGILDRFEDHKAVILIEEKNKELIIDRSHLPPGSSENTYFSIEEKNGEYKITAIDEETTELQAKKSSELMKQLRKKSSGSKFKKK